MFPLHTPFSCTLYVFEAQQQPWEIAIEKLAAQILQMLNGNYASY